MFFLRMIFLKTQVQDERFLIIWWVRKCVTRCEDPFDLRLCFLRCSNRHEITPTSRIKRKPVTFASLLSASICSWDSAAFSLIFLNQRKNEIKTPIIIPSQTLVALIGLPRYSADTFEVAGCISALLSSIIGLEALMKAAEDTLLRSDIIFLLNGESEYIVGVKMWMYVYIYT